MTIAFGNRLVELRKKAGLSQEAVADGRQGKLAPTPITSSPLPTSMVARSTNWSVSPRPTK